MGNKRFLWLFPCIQVLAMQIPYEAKWLSLDNTVNFICVSAKGTSKQQGSANYNWNAHNLSTSSTADDVGFLNTLLDSMIIKYAVDTCRIYILGFSMVHRCRGEWCATLLTGLLLLCHLVVLGNMAKMGFAIIALHDQS